MKLVEGLPDRRTSEICLKIVDYLVERSDAELQMITFYTLTKLLGKPHVDGDLLTALAILVNSSIEALESRALLVDDDDREHEIDADELAEARRSGELVHPETGKLISNFESKLIPFFVPSEKFREIKAEENG